MTADRFTPPGWYRDDKGQMRWWDGFAWTAAVPQFPPPPALAPRKSKPWTAIAAAVLALMGTVAHLLGGIEVAVNAAGLNPSGKLLVAGMPSWYTAWVLFSLAIALTTAAVLLVGGVSLLLRGRHAATLITTGCFIVLGMGLIRFGIVSPAMSAKGFHLVLSPAILVAQVIILSCPVITLFLVWASRTRQWIASANTSIARAD